MRRKPARRRQVGRRSVGCLRCAARHIANLRHQTRGHRHAIYRRHFLTTATSATALLAAPRPPLPSYPVERPWLIVPFRRVARMTPRPPWADRIKPYLGSVVIENIGGGGASLGAAAAAAATDGYTLLLGGTLPHVNEALLKAKPLYDPVKDRSDHAHCGRLPGDRRAPVGAGEHAGRVVAYIKQNPGKVSYGHSGVGGTNHLIGELFKSVAGIPDLIQVRIAAPAPR